LENRSRKSKLGEAGINIFGKSKPARVFTLLSLENIDFSGVSEYLSPESLDGKGLQQMHAPQWRN